MAHVKRLERSAMRAPLAEKFKVERNLFLDLMTTDWAIDAMKPYVRNLEEQSWEETPRWADSMAESQ